MLNKILKYAPKKLRIEGHIDFLETQNLSGWFMDSENGVPLELSFFRGSELLGKTNVDAYRDDLAAINKINPVSGFHLELSEELDFTNLPQYTIYINGKPSSYATSEFKQVAAQYVDSKLRVTENIPQLIKDRDWLIKMRKEDEMKISYLNRCELILQDMLSSQEGSKSDFRKRYLDARDKKEFDDLISLDTDYEKKKEGFAYIASNILDRDLENDDINLDFEQFEKPRLSVILVLYNKAELTYQCLKSLKEESDVEYELIIIDNDSSDKTSFLMEKVSGVKYIRNEENVGFLKACNQAREFVNSEYILLLNNDALLHKGTMKSGLEAFDKDDNVGVVGGKILHLDGLLQEAGSIIWSDASCLGYGRREEPDNYKFSYRREVDYVSGALFFTPIALWDELSGFDERLAPCYYEETDFCIRASQLGYKIIMEPDCQITHFEFGSSSHSDFAVKQMQKNRLLIQKIHENYLAEKYEPKPENIEVAARSSKRKTVLYMDDQVPFEILGSGFPRSRDVVSEIKKLSNVIIYPFCENDLLGDMSIYQDVLILPHSEDHAYEYISSVISQIDMVWVSRPHNMQKLIERRWIDFFRSNNVEVIYDAEAIFSEREKLRCHLKELPYDIGIEEKEFELIDYADGVVSVSKAEKEKIQDRFENPVHVIGHPCKINEVKKRKNRNILFIGNLQGSSLESPNVDSVEYFLEKYLELLQNNKITLTLVGKIDDDNRKRWESENVIVKGAVDSLKDEFESAICTIAPTRFAAGIPHKVHESLSWSTPVLATPLILKQCGFGQDESSGLLSEFNIINICSDRSLADKIMNYQKQAAKPDMDLSFVQSTIKNIVCK